MIERVQSDADLAIAISDDVKELIADQTETIFSSLVEETPVRTGNLRASWHVSEGTPEYKDIDGGSVDAPLPPPRFIRPILKDKYPVVFITNGKPYGIFLNDGTEKLAPHNFIEHAIEKAR